MCGQCWGSAGGQCLACLDALPKGMRKGQSCTWREILFCTLHPVLLVSSMSFTEALLTPSSWGMMGHNTAGHNT